MGGVTFRYPCFFVREYNNLMKVARQENVAVEASAQRQIVSYFDHEFSRPAVQKIDADLTEMKNNDFTHVVLTMSEGDIETRARRSTVRTLISEIQDRDLQVWIDPWHVGSVFGGEAQSLFEQSGEMSCFCNPKLDNLMNKWIDTAAELGTDTIFWDEPEMKCDNHHNKGYELPFLEKYIAAAGQLALSSVVVLPADERRSKQFVDVSALPDVVEIGSDPYFPNAFDKTITEAKRLGYQWYWSNYVKQVAEAAGKRSHIWIQNFGIPEGREAMIEEHITTAKEVIGSIAIWGFHGCASVPDFHKEGTLLPMRHWETTVQTLNKFKDDGDELVA